MAPVTEIALLPLKTGDYPDDTTSRTGQVWQDTLSTVLDQDGAQRCYWAREVENPDMLRLFVDWDSLDHHKKFIASEVYKPFVDHLMSILDGEPTLYHASMTPHPPSSALSDTTSPATEVITIYLPSTYSADEQATFEDGIKKLIACVEENADGYTGSAGGWVIEERPLPKNASEKAKVYVAAIGWKSVEAHMAFRNTQPFKDNIHHLRGAKNLQDMSVVHAHLLEVQPGFASGGEMGRPLDAQEEILNPQAAGKASVKTKADGTTTKNDDGLSGAANSNKKERSGRGGPTEFS